jgi:general secretion pathway protein H
MTSRNRLPLQVEPRRRRQESEGGSRVGRPPQAGFTLMEMLVVIVAMGLILLLVTGYGPPRSHRLEAQAAARQVAAAMRAARGRAIGQDQNVPLSLPRLPAWLAVSIQAPPGGIVFAPDGSASGGQVRLDGAGQDIAVSVDWLTGRVTVDAP